MDSRGPSLRWEHRDRQYVRVCNGRRGKRRRNEERRNDTGSSHISGRRRRGDTTQSGKKDTLSGLRFETQDRHYPSPHLFLSTVRTWTDSQVTHGPRVSRVAEEESGPVGRADTGTTKGPGSVWFRVPWVSQVPLSVPSPNPLVSPFVPVVWYPFLLLI